MNARGVGRWLCMLVDSRDGWSLADSRGLSRTLSRAQDKGEQRRQRRETIHHSSHSHEGISGKTQPNGGRGEVKLDRPGWRLLKQHRPLVRVAVIYIHIQREADLHYLAVCSVQCAVYERECFTTGSNVGRVAESAIRCWPGQPLVVGISRPKTESRSRIEGHTVHIIQNRAHSPPSTVLSCAAAAAAAAVSLVAVAVAVARVLFVAPRKTG